MRVVAFNGSPRAHGNTEILLKTVLEVLEQHDITTELIHLGKRAIHPCAACYKCKENKNKRCIFDDDGVNDYISLVHEADGIILGTPTYFADLTAQMKAFIDRVGMVTRGNDFMLRRKLGAGVVAVRRAGSLQAFHSMNSFFLVNEMIVPGSTYWNCGIGRDPGDVEADEEGMQTMRDLGENFAFVLERMLHQCPEVEEKVEENTED